MKTAFKQTYGSRTTTLTPPRVHLTTPVRAKSHRTSTISPPIGLDEASSAPVKAAVESTPPANNAAARGDSLQLYLQEIGQVKLLTPKEELELAKRVQRGDERGREAGDDRDQRGPQRMAAAYMERPTWLRSEVPRCPGENASELGKEIHAHSLCNSRFFFGHLVQLLCAHSHLLGYMSSAPTIAPEMNVRVL